MLVHQHEGFVLVPLGFHPFQSKVGDHVRGVSDVFDHLIMLAVSVRIQTHRRVVVRSLSDQNFRVIVTLGRHVSTEMPLSHHSGGVACLLEKLGEGLLSPIEFVSVDQEAVGMGVLAGLDGGAHGPADGVCDIALLEKHTVSGE